MHDEQHSDDSVSPTAMPILETERLLIRPFRMDDIQALHRILDVEVHGVEDAEKTLALRREYVEWSIRNYRQLALLYQPPYGERAIVRKVDDTLIGACGLVPSMGPFGMYPPFAEVPTSARNCHLPQVGLFYTISTSVRGQGFATEAARALIEYGFTALNLWRIIATTTYDNAASMAVMRRLGMTVERNPETLPEWSQVVGTIVNPAVRDRG